MLPAASRMRRSDDFDRVVRGRRSSRPLLTVHLSDPTAHASSADVRVGFVVSRKVGNAVTRNRLRRQLRHIVRCRLVQMEEAAPGASVVVRVAPRAAGASADQLAADFDAAWQHLVGRTR